MLGLEGVCSTNLTGSTSVQTLLRAKVRETEKEKGGWGERREPDEMLKVWDGHVHTAIFKMNNQQRPTVQHREL